MNSPVTLDSLAFGRIQQEMGVLQSNNLILMTEVDRLQAEAKGSAETIESLRLRVKNSDETIRGLRDELDRTKQGLRERLTGKV